MESSGAHDQKLGPSPDSTAEAEASRQDFSCTKFQKTGRRRVKQGPAASASHKRTLKRWTGEEDQELLELFLKTGNDWEEIARNMKSRAPSAVKNRFYWLYNSKLSVQTKNKIKTTCIVKKMYKSPVNSSELYRKINNYLREEVICQSFLDVETPEPYSHLVHKLNIAPQNVESHTRMQKLFEQAQSLYKYCEKAKAGLLEKT